MKTALMSIALTGLIAGSLFAGPIAKAKKNQQQRIAQGVRSGQLTPRETANLENKERAINGEIRHDRRTDGGQLTQAQRQQVRAQQGNLSKQIYADKHNAAQDHFGNSEVGRREQKQQDRIANGIQSGKLKPGQTANLENREANVQQEIHDDRAYNNGKLTPGEKKSINQQQDHLSNSIYKDKHN